MPAINGSKMFCLHLGVDYIFLTNFHGAIKQTPWNYYFLYTSLVIIFRNNALEVWQY